MNAWAAIFWQHILVAWPDGRASQNDADCSCFADEKLEGRAHSI
jgi:hypothetical protein